MYGTRKYRRLLGPSIFLVVIFGVFSWQGVSRVFSDEDDSEEVSESVVWEGSKTIAGYVSIDPEVTVTVAKGTRLVFEDGARLAVQGTLVVDGTVKEPVLFAKQHPEVLEETYAVSVERGGVAHLKNVDISGGGSFGSVFQSRANSSFVPVASALDVYTGAIEVKSEGKLFADGVSFHHNVVALLLQGGWWSINDVSVHRSKFFQNSQFDVVNEAHDNTSYDFRYNWWDHATNEAGHEHILGSLDTRFAADSRDFHDPVIIIPGILGSYPILRAHETEPVWALDPLFQNYRDLVASLKRNGLEGEIYEFPYDWRESNVMSAGLLRQKIEQIREDRHWPKVDIVAHSMGGLVAREYIESDEYQGDIDQLITLGTPQLGAPEAYLKWDGATILGPGSLMYRFVFKQWAEHEGFDDVYDYLHKKPMHSVQELLPVYDYLARRQDGKFVLSSYGDGYPRNDFLENLNAPDHVGRLAGVEFTKIVGKFRDDESTIAGFRTVDIEQGKFWKHGYPDDIESLNPSNESRGIIGSDGDGTVPLASALASEIPSEYTLVLDGVAHNDLPTEGQSAVLETLGMPRPYEEVRMSKIQKKLAFFLFSPINLQIISPSGKRVGKNFENGSIYDEIPGAFYTGYHTNNEFVTIPNPEKGEYRVLTQGTGTGKYRIEIAHISENKERGKPATESVVTLSGNAQTDVVTEESIIVTDDAVAVRGEPVDILPPVTKISLSGIQGQRDWYTSPVVVTLIAQDEESGTKQTEYSFDEGHSWNVYISPFTLTNEGGSSLQYRSTDQAGNQEVTHTQLIQIDTTPPEARIFFHSETQKLDIIGEDTVDQNMSLPTVQVTDTPIVLTAWQKWLMKFWGATFPTTRTTLTATLVDAAGQSTILTFDQVRKQKNRLFFTFQSIDSGGVVTPNRWRPFNTSGRKTKINV